MPDLPGHDRREERRARRRGRRLVRSGELFNSDEDVELEKPEPSNPEAGEGGYEPWATDGSKPQSSRDLDRLRSYREYLDARHDDPRTGPEDS